MAAATVLALLALFAGVPATAAPAGEPAAGAPPAGPAPGGAPRVEGSIADIDEWMPDAMAYLRGENRRIVGRFAREHPGEVPPLVLLLLADARFRAGQDRTATRLLDRLVAELPDARGTTARVQLALIALARTDVARLDDLHEPLAAFSRPAGQVAALLREMAAGAAAPGEAATALERLARDPDLVPALHAPAAQAAALARLWSGDPARAAAGFDALAADRDAGVLADDARYGAAVARWHAGATAQALGALAELAREAGDRTAPGVSRSRLLLERDAVLHAGVARLRRRSLAAPEQHLLTLLDDDGPALARRALELLPTGDEAHATPSHAAGGSREVPAPVVAADGRPDVAAATVGPSGHVAERPEAPAPSRGWLLAALVLAVLAAAGLAMRAVRVPKTR